MRQGRRRVSNLGLDFEVFRPGLLTTPHRETEEPLGEPLSRPRLRYEENLDTRVGKTPHREAEEFSGEPLSLKKAESTLPQILAVGRAILTATEAHAEYSAAHLANFVTLCTQLVEVHGLPLERCLSFGQAIDIDRLSTNLVKLLDENTIRQLVSVHANGAQFDLTGRMGKIDELHSARPVPQPEENRGPSLVDAYNNMKKLTVFMVIDRDQKVPVSPTFSVPKKDDLGFEKTNDEGNPILRSTIHLSAKVCPKPGGHGGKNAEDGSVNDFMVKWKASVDEMTYPSQLDVLGDRVRVSADYPGVRSLTSKEDLS